MQKEVITFSFGQNWKNYLNKVGTSGLTSAKDQIKDWLVNSGGCDLKSASVIDIGSGSGLMSLSLYMLETKNITSFDYDIHSVESTKYLKNMKDNPKNWEIFQGSVLDKNLINKLPKYDVVYSWGVLHHTGKMWEAISNAAELVKQDGLFYFSIYAAGPLYPKHLKLKQKYNNGSWLTKKMMEWKEIRKCMRLAKKRYGSRFKWNRIKEDERGMDVYHDIIDWLGGLPYEVATPDEIDSFMTQRNFVQVRVLKRDEGGCSEYLYRKL